MKPKILIVEDDRGMATLTKRVLEDGDFEAERVPDADKALEYLKSNHCDLLVLDVNLPGLSGTQLCGILRKDPKTASLPILMLTMLGKEKEKLQGFQAGTDDYLVKPFTPEELVARVKALLRRSIRAEIGAFLSAADIRVDLDRHEAWVKNKKADLRPKEYDLLVTFLKNPGKLLSPQALTERVWGLDAVVTRHTINEHIKNLRKKLGKSGDLIETVTEAGYRFNQP